MAQAKIILPKEYQMSRLDETTNELEKIIATAESLVETDNPHNIVESLVRIAHALQTVAVLFERLEGIERKIRSEFLPDIFGETTTSITTLGYRATVSQSVRASIRATAKEAALKWLEDHGHDSIIDREPRVNSQTLSAWAKAMIGDGEDLPEELFSLFYFRNTSLTKATKK